MYRKIVWCYVALLTLLDISLNSKLSAQGKSHGKIDYLIPNVSFFLDAVDGEQQHPVIGVFSGTAYSVHDTLAEGVNFQEWGKEASAGGAGGEPGTEGLPLRLYPAALSFGARPLGKAHAATVTLVNAANVTLHLASVAGTTPDFHASFFDTKTLAPQGNTTFNVVFLGRREGPTAAHLYIHTSLGAHKYPVSGVGVSSQWEVWPLLGVRVPANATLEPQLRVRNPTDTPVQVTEVYSSGSWVKLVLPEGEGGEGAGEGVRAERWVLPPHSARCVLTLRLQPPPHQHAATAYVRIKTNTSDSGLIIAIEARAAAAGEFASPVQLRLRARGHLDPQDTWEISVGNSAGTGARLEAGVTDARCLPTHMAHTAPPHGTAPNSHTPTEHAHHNGVKSSGASVSLLRPDVDPFQPLTKTAQLTLDYEKLWEEFSKDPSIEVQYKGEGAYCSGSLSVGRASVPYSLRLLPGTLALTPTHLHLITSDVDESGASRPIQLVAHNQFSVPIHLAHLQYPDTVDDLAHVTGFTQQVIPPKEKAVVATFRLKDDVGALATLDARLVLHTNVSAYTVPLRVYSGKLLLEWEWPVSEGGDVNVGAVGTSSTRRVTARLTNPAPAPLCVRALATTLPGARLALADCPHLHPAPPPHHPQQHPCRCIEPNSWSHAVLTVVAPARPGALRGVVTVSTEHATTEGTVTLTAHAGKVAAQTLALDAAAPYAWAVAPVIIDNSMSLRMRVTGWSDGAGGVTDGPDLALVYKAPPGAEVAPGRGEVGAVTYMPERVCEPNCYTGLDPYSEEGKAWVSNGEAWNSGPESGGAIERALKADRALLGQREALLPQRGANISLHIHTSQVVQIPVWGWVRVWWPRLSGGGGAVAGGTLAGVGGATSLRVRVKNPSISHHILLHPVIGPPPDTVPHVWSDAESPLCSGSECTPRAEAFALTQWRTVAGDAREWPHTHGRFGSNSSWSLPLLALGPSAEVELTINFVPREPSLLTAYLYLRNNLTIVEGIQLAGRGAYPTFELGGRRPGSTAPLVFEVTECGAAGTVKRVLAARNTGEVGVRLREWRLAGAPCAARGFALSPCGPLALQPNKSSPITVTFTPDFTLARVPATLELRTERSRVTFQLAAVTSPKLLAKCSAQAPKPPFDPPLRAGGTLLALALLALVLSAAALDAERLLRKARAVRAASQTRAPLDLRAVAAAPAPPPPPPPATPRAPPPRRKKIRKMDPAAESRAFERWRASLRRTDDTDSRSSEDLEPELTQPEPLPPETTSNISHSNVSNPPTAPPPPYEPLLEIESNQNQHSSGDDEPHSSESESSSPLEHDDDERKVEKPIENHEDTIESTIKRDTPIVGHSPVENQSRTRRRDAESRRTERRSESDVSRCVRGSASKHHTRKDKPRARRERAAPTPPRSSPPTTEPRGGSASSPNGGSVCGGSGGSVRWGASWSSVVARSSATPPAPAPPHTPAPLPDKPTPLPASIPTPAPAPAPQPRIQESNSLFYFNGEPPSMARPEAEYSWRAPSADRPFGTPTTDFLGEDPVSSSNSYGSIGSAPPVWSGALGALGALEARAPGAAWPHPHPCPWPNSSNNINYTPTSNIGAGPVRPPPGFGAPPTTVGSLSAGGAVGSMGPGPVGSRNVRPFDPFQSLAAIWSRTALDWRHDDNQRDN